MAGMTIEEKAGAYDELRYRANVLGYATVGELVTHMEKIIRRCEGLGYSPPDVAIDELEAMEAT